MRLPRAPRQLVSPSSRKWSQMVPSIVHPHVIPNNWRVVAGHWAIPSEEQLLRCDFYVPGYDIPNEALTGVNTSALAYAASHALSISETPIVYAYRNILLEARTYRVKAFIDWDDVHVLPFIVGVDFPEDIKAFSIKGLSADSNYYLDGEFPSFPPDEYGKIVGAVDKFGKLTDVDGGGQITGVYERDERIRNTLLREQFIRTLGMQDKRITQPDMWKVRSKVLKAHDLITSGGRMWWDKREWLGRELGGGLRT